MVERTLVEQALGRTTAALNHAAPAAQTTEADHDGR